MVQGVLSVRLSENALAQFFACDLVVRVAAQMSAFVRFAQAAGNG